MAGNERRSRAARWRQSLSGAPILLALFFWISGAQADMSACGSAFTKESLDDQIRLYTLCLKKGQTSPKTVAGAFLNRGIAYQRKGELDRALADFNKSIQYDPVYGLAYLNRAFLHLRQGELDLAEADYTESLRRPLYRPKDQAYSYRGLIRMSRGSCGEALQDFNSALKVNRQSAWVHGARAWVLATCDDEAQRNGEEALDSARQALTLQDNWKLRDAMAAAYAELGRFGDSVRELKLAQDRIEYDDSGSPSRAGLQSRLALYESGQPYREPAGEANIAEWLTAF